MPNWVYRDGQRLTPAMLHDFLLLDADFARRTGEHLKIRSGIRTDEEQERIWYDRMVLAHQVNGRRVYETRWWNGRMWYRISSAGTVAPPRTSNHQINVAAGRRGALDLYDTGRDAGILTRGSFRARVFDEIAGKYGYDSEGYNFGETWHKRYNRDPWRAVPSTSGGGSRPAPTKPTKKRSKKMSNGVIYTDDRSDSKRSGAIVNYEAGTFDPFGWFPVSYANQLAVGFGLEAAAKVTRGHYDQIKKTIADKAARDGKVFVDIADEDVPKIGEGE